MRTQRDYDAATAQLRKSIADLTDDHIATFRDRDPDFADRVEAARARHRRGAEYQQKIAAATVEEDYARDVRRRQRADSLRQHEACWNGSEPRRVLPRKSGVVRITPRGRR